jgi:tripartite-type tricarboxylate transporter receptor subunit TctC
MTHPIAATLLIAALILAPAVAAQNYPTKAVRILSSGGAGGNNDTQTRGLAQYLSDRLGQPFVVENRTGAGGMIAGESCVKAAPDGHTLCTFGVNAISWNPVLTLNMPYDPIKDMVGVAHTGYVDSILTAHPSVPFNSLSELMTVARAKPSFVSWGSFGLNTSGHFYIEWLKKFRGIEILHIPYKTSIQAQQAVVAGEVMVNSYAAGQAMAMIKGGKVKAISVNTDKRLPELPAVQTEIEAGMELPLGTWFGMLGTAAIPKEVLTRLNGEINRIMAEPKFVEVYMVRLGFRGTNMNVDEFNAFLRTHRANFEKFARDMGLEKK